MSVLAALRAATARQHDRLEAVMDLDPPRLTPARYGAALQLLLAARSGWEPELEALHPGSTGPHRAWLMQDLVQLRLPRLAPEPPLGLAGEGAWGVRYVLEGSALGGRVLLRRVAAFGFTPAAGARYFAGRGAETMPGWRRFLAALDQAGTAAATPGIVRGAVRAFDALAARGEAEAAGVSSPR